MRRVADCAGLQQLCSWRGRSCTAGLLVPWLFWSSPPRPPQGQDGTHFFQLSSGPDSASKRHSQMAAGVSIAVDGDTLVIGGGNDSDEDGQHSGGDSLDWM